MTEKIDAPLVIPPGFDAWGQPICTCPSGYVSDFPLYDVTCRRHGHLVAPLRTTTTNRITAFRVTA